MSEDFGLLGRVRSQRKENLALDDELKSLKKTFNLLQQAHRDIVKSQADRIERLRAKLYECNEEKERRGVILGIE
jgi:hypothetical protein